MSDDDAKRLIKFMADFCYNCSIGRSYAETIEGHEATILADFRRGTHPWDSAGRDRC